ncbi:MAG TPA: aminopeptidase N [Marmoricola sp.]|nr:aminopeptidase N [Marmoricola sp.]
MQSLKLAEARERFDLLSPVAYDVTLDLAADTATFRSVTRLRFRSGAGSTFVDVRPVSLDLVELDGVALDPGRLVDGRFPLELGEGEHDLVVDAVMPFRNDGEGLHRSHDPSDGRDYVYGMSFMDAAPTVFACFDQPDLKAPYTLHVVAPGDWLVAANAAGREVGHGRWEFEESLPLATYFVTLLAGPYHVVEDDHDDIPLRLFARQSLGHALDTQADDILAVTKACFDEFHRLFGVRYPFGKYDQAFVPEFNAGAMENPGLVTFRDLYLLPARSTRAQLINRATVVAHEMAHQWFGNLVTPEWWDDLWLNESFAEYLGMRAAAEATEYDDAWAWSALVRKTWGLAADTSPSTHPVAGNGADDAHGALQDFDGISYAKGSAALRQLAARIGDDAFLGGVRDHFERHRYGNATMHDLFASWERAGAGDLSGWTESWLRTSGMDTLRLDRERGALVRLDGAGAARPHALDVAVWSGTAWTVEPLTLDDGAAPVPALEKATRDAPVLVDPHERTWAEIGLDEATLHQLPELLPTMRDPLMRASVWNAVRHGVHQGTLAPHRALDLLCAGIPSEDQDAALSTLGHWGSTEQGARLSLSGKLPAVVADPDGATSRLHDAFAARLATAEPGSGVQLAALHGVVATSSSAGELIEMLEGTLPPRTELDRDLRWRIVKRLTALGHADRPFLAEQLELQRTDAAVNAWTWCMAAIADEQAKAWAWDRFTGAVGANNYELEMAGLGMWRPGQEALLAPWVDRYFDDVAATGQVRAGWALAATGQFFYPITALSDSTVAATEKVCADPTLDPGLRRRLVDCADEVRRRLHARTVS